MDEIRRRWMRLPVRLTEEELEKKRAELVDWVRTRSDNESELEAWISEMKEAKKLKEAQILAAAGYANQAADIVAAREERRDVEVGDFFDAGNIVTLRLDLGEIVATRPADETERQLLLSLPEKKTEEATETEPVHKPQEEGEAVEDHQEVGSVTSSQWNLLTNRAARSLAAAVDGTEVDDPEGVG